MKIKELESQVENLKREEAEQINDKETIKVCNYYKNLSNGFQHPFKVNQPCQTLSNDFWISENL